jgi:hypothetical protein
MAGLLDGVLPYLYSRGDWAKRQVRGLLDDPMGSFEQTAGNIQDSHKAQMGLLGQAFADPKRPFNVTDQQALSQAAQNMLNGPLGFAPAGITAWHGSPHIFDKFDSSKIGTGEGAQAYGHGLYLAESPKVAMEYQQKLSHAGAAKRAVAQNTGNIDAALAGAEKSVADYRELIANGGGGDPRRAQGFLNLSLKRLEDIQRMKAGLPENTGALYKVDLPDDAVAKMLDYDGAVPEPVRQKVSQAAMQRFGSGATGTSGEHLYNELVSEFTRAGSKTPAAEATEFLRQQGIPGMRYWDGGSRGQGAGTSNFVVFPGEEKMLSILERR